jgi:outer membrane protein assembly factor BamB
MAPFGGRLSDAYLVKLDLQGRVTWERTFGGKSQRTIRDMAVLSTGDIVVVGGDDWKTWLARVSPDGQLLWERTFGLSTMAAVAAKQSTILVAAFDGQEWGEDKSHSGIAVWRFDLTGRELGQRRVEEVIDKRPRNYRLWKLLVSPVEDAVYFFGRWRDVHESGPLLAIKLDFQGQMKWRAELPLLVSQDGLPDTRFRGPIYCDPNLAVLADGSPIVECMTLSGHRFVRFNSNSGAETQFELPSVPCDGQRGAIRMIAESSKENVWVSGYLRGCLWRGQLSLGSR